MICKTTKGYPIKYMMNVPIWHYRSPNKKEYVDALKNLYKHYKKRNKFAEVLFEFSKKMRKLD